MTQSHTDTYKAALKEARAAFTTVTKQLFETNEESRRLADERNRLRKTITALSALCSESPGFDNLGITDACMEVMEATAFGQTTANVVELLEEIGYDFSSTKNPAASVHAVLTRLATRGKIQRIQKDKDTVVWRGPNWDKENEFAEEIPF